MTIRNLIKKTSETIMYGSFPYGVMKHVPQGFDFYFDLRKYKSDYRPKVVFDVGANIGQTVTKWNKYFSNVEYHCFEPVSSTMAQLKQNTAKFSNIHYHQCALGPEKKETQIALFDDSSLNSVLDSLKDSDVRTEAVQINVLDDLCLEQSIQFIDVLKIDTEGYDLEVLKGARSMLESNSITFIQVEAGMNPHNRLHVPLQDFVDYLAPLGYVLFGIYEQHLEWSGEKWLSFSNPVFISEKHAIKSS